VIVNLHTVFTLRFDDPIEDFRRDLEVIERSLPEIELLYRRQWPRLAYLLGEPRRSTNRWGIGEGRE